MDSKIEKLEKSTVKLIFTIPAERVEEGMSFSYNKNKHKVNLPGFRKGKAPRAMIERHYGTGFLMDDALEFVFPEAYSAAVKEHELSPVARPEIDSVDFDKEKGLSVEVIVTVKPEVTLGKYKAVHFNDYKIEVEDSEVEAEIDKDREKNARLVTVSRPAENGDAAIIDFEGFIDGEAFEGGKGEGFELHLGSHTFIDTFEEQLIGKNAGDELDVCVTFPSDYGQESLAGKPAVFKVKINEITSKELPALDDEFAQDVSEFETFSEYKNSIKEKLIHQKEHKKEHDVEDELIQKVAEDAEVEIPEVMIENRINQMLQEFENRLRAQGMDFETFLKYSGQTPEALIESYRKPAENNVRARLVLEKIAETEGLELSEDEINEEIKKIAEAYGIPEDRIRETLRGEDLKGLETDLLTQKAFKLIKDSAFAKK